MGRNVFVYMLAAVFFGNLLSLFVWEKWTVYQLAATTAEVNKAFATAMEIEKQEADRSRLIQEQRTATARSEQMRLEERQNYQRQELQARREADDRMKAEKEAAWLSYYKRPKSCEQVTEANMTYCGDAYINAKKRFEHLWEKGSFQKSRDRLVIE